MTLKSSESLKFIKIPQPFLYLIILWYFQKVSLKFGYIGKKAYFQEIKFSTTFDWSGILTNDIFNIFTKHLRCKDWCSLQDTREIDAITSHWRQFYHIHLPQLLHLWFSLSKPSFSINQKKKSLFFSFFDKTMFKIWW